MPENKILKIYANRDFVCSSGYTPLLFPFWGPVLKSTTPYLAAVFEKYNFDKTYYSLVDNIEEADFVLVPHNYWFFKKKNPKLLAKCLGEARQHNKLILIDAQGDSAESINIENAYILRTSQYKFQMKKNEIMIPAYAEDLLETYFGGELQIREREDLPVVGFAGWAEMPFLSRIKSLVKEIPIRLLGLFNKKYHALEKGIFFRKKALDILNKSKLAKTNFIIRKFYSGHSQTIEGNFKNIRREFVENIIDSDYILCVKGDGNYSTRFYEALSLGRIPLFVDTESVLPLEDVINYKDFCVFVGFRDLPKIGKILADFHKNLTNEQFEEMQKKARIAFENYLRIDKFTKYLAGRLKKVVRDFYK